MKKVFIILKKELTDTLRDRRTLVMMLVLPILLIFLFVNISVTLSRSQTRKAEEKVLKVGLFTEGNARDFQAFLIKQKNIKVKENQAVDKITYLIREKKLDFAIVFSADFDRQVKERQSGEVRVYFRASREINIAKKRITNALLAYKKHLLDRRIREINNQYQELGLEISFVEPLKINEMDLSTTKEKIGESIGGLIPYLFVIFCFLGAMYPAIDLAAGEKERATIETLLSSPASRLQIVLGKFLVVTLAGIISAVISVLALYLSIKQATALPKQVLDALMRIIQFKSIVLVFSLLIPLCVFFAAILLSLSIFAKSFKEAQSIMTPMNFLVIIPVLIGLFPGIKLNATTGLIPVLNVSLATKEIISGTIKTGLLLEVYFSLFALALLSLLFCVRWFNREDVIFRGI